MKQWISDACAIAKLFWQVVKYIVTGKNDPFKG